MSWRESTTPRLLAGVLVGLLVGGACGGGAPVATPAPTPTPPPVAVVDLAELVRSAVVVEGIACGRTSVGSGVVTDAGILTNAHVVAGVEDLTVRDVRGDELPAIVVAFDPETDLALLRASDLDAPALPVGVPRAGTDVVALVGGGGEIQARPASIERTITITISDIYGDGTFRRAGLELGAAIAPGDSGAALVDDRGDVVGLVFSASQRNDAVSYAVSSTEFAELVASVTAESEAVDVGPCR